MATDDEVQVALVAEGFLSAVAADPRRKWQRTCDPSEVLQRCVTIAGVLDAAALARQVNVSRITAWGWLNGKSVPDFSATLRLCRCFGMSVEGFLTGRIPSDLELHPSGELSIRAVRRPPASRDDIGLAKAMERCCGERRERPPSLAEVAETVGISARVLRKRFPVASRAISERWREFVRAQRLARHEELRQAIHDAVLRARIERVKLRRSDLIKLLPKPGVMRSAAARDLLKQMLLDFGTSEVPNSTSPNPSTKL